jgi:asparagine synthase (glutamine-hydrolysing)
MCGIAGIVSKTQQGSLRDTIFAMSQAIQHRGPDGEGFAFFAKDKALPVFSPHTPDHIRSCKAFSYMPSVPITDVADDHTMAFAHRRLSIIDLSEAGHQPMCDAAGSYWITFNGEIYNYIELRNELKQKGHQFMTQTDTEVILAAYKEWGVNCLQKFNGMFALVLFDTKNNELFCARDRAGVKPFYYINTKDSFAFASEYKAFIKAKLIPFEINEAQQFDFIVNANLETGQESLFKQIKELKPSHYAHYKLNTHELSVKRYYSLPENNYLELSDGEIINRIEEKLLSAIKLRLRSDVEVGSCLSGGLDSSIIAGLVKALQPETSLKLFTAVFKGESFDESAYAQSVAEHVKGSWQTVSPTSEEFFRDIKELNYSQDLPVWSSSTYSQHRVMKLAAEHKVKVVLDGQGADELFGGYAHHYLALWRESSLGKRLKYIRESEQTIVNPFQLYFKQELKDLLNVSNNFGAYFKADKKGYGKANHIPFASNLNEELRKDYTGRLKSFLKCEDRCSMAFGIESRVPFADDIELVELAFSIKGSSKIRHGISKYLLREATKQYIPQHIYNRRDKVGFETPLVKWMQQNKFPVLNELKNGLDFINFDRLNTDFDKLILEKPTFLLRLFSFFVWKNVFSHS